MKKFLIPLFLCVLVFGVRVSAAQATACPNGTDAECAALTGPSQVCNPDTKQCIDPDSGDYNSTGGIGSTCKNDNECTGNTTECNLTTHKCVYGAPQTAATPAATTPAAGASAATTPAAATPATGSTGSNFVQLTSFPGIATLANSSSPGDFAAFFNNLYKICIGIAAVLAVIQIVHAGFLWMSAGDSAEKVSNARHLIGASIFGLVLVLSPVIVFSIVNPNVLRLNLAFSSLKSAPVLQQTPGATDANCKNEASSCAQAPAPTRAGCQPIANNTILQGNDTPDAYCCSSQTSQYASCVATQQNRMVGSSPQTTYLCACTVNTQVAVDYYDVFTKTGTEQGLAASDLANYKSFRTSCINAGGTPTTANLNANGYGSDPYVACPTNKNIANASTLQCKYMEISCNNK